MPTFWQSRWQRLALDCQAPADYGARPRKSARIAERSLGVANDARGLWRGCLERSILGLHCGWGGDSMRALVLVSIALVFAGGCSKTASPPANTASAAAAVTPAGASNGDSASSAAGGDCALRAISQADVQPLLTGPITSMKPSPSDPNSCVFSTAGFSSITIAVHPGEGKQTLQSWHKGPVTPVPGVGDDAVWEPDLKELVAAKGDTLCTVTAMGSEVAPATAQTTGALCNKAFAGL